MTVQIILFAAIGLIAGGGLGFIISNLLQTKKSENQAQQIIREATQQAENIKKDRILEAKEKFLQLKAEHEKEVNRRNQEIASAENRMKQKEQSLDQRIQNAKSKEEEAEKLKQKLNQQTDALALKRQELETQREQQIKALEKIAGLTQEEAKEQMLETIRANSQTEALQLAKNILDEAKVSATRDAKRIVLQTIQRTAAEEAIDNTVTAVPIENDEIKGRIIGREGRNIKAFEAATGVEIVIDDTPEMVMLSCFDSVRREVARLALQRLIADGRVHPARIEEVVEKTRREIEEEVLAWGERTVIDLGITGLHPELIRYVGRMRFRASYGQNLLKHSREVARLCATMAAEMGLNPKMAKRAGLLHDIGKVPDFDEETPHALLSMKLCEKYGEHADICNAVGAHHDEIEMKTLIAPIVQACDAISGSRPGARRADESYMKRISDMETMALGYPGVESSFAIQAGRELRVILNADKVTDEQADTIAFDLSQRITKEMKFPGQIKITVIREKRSVGFAK
ncbi:MAG: ribonuclease Y [Bacteroidetes bacterium]|nr:ribonuclease Y [Bacteroidota bacterium]